MPLTNFFWEPLSDNILQERDELGALTAEYTTEPGLYGNVISQSRDGVESQFHFDASGSTLALSGSNEQTTDTRAYSAFGETTESAGTTAIQFDYGGKSGYYHGGSGQHDVRRRSLNTVAGRWLSVDPSFVLAPLLSAYSYSSNSPVNGYDPSGELAQVPTSAPPIVAPEGCGHIVIFTSPIMPCGGYVWPTQWQPANNQKDGLILQKVCVEGSLTPCDPKTFNCKVDWDNISVGTPCPNRVAKPCRGDAFPPRASFCYVEIWRARGGIVTGSQIFSDNPKDVPEGSHDIFAFLGCRAPCRNKSKGKITQTGEAFFISIADLERWDRKWQARLRKLFGTGENGVTWACSLVSGCWDKSAGRDKVSTVFAALRGTSVLATKRLVREWNCCTTCCRTGLFRTEIGDTIDIDIEDQQWPGCEFDE